MSTSILNIGTVNQTIPTPDNAYQVNIITLGVVDYTKAYDFLYQQIQQYNDLTNTVMYLFKSFGYNGIHEFIYANIDYVFRYVYFQTNVVKDEFNHFVQVLGQIGLGSEEIELLVVELLTPIIQIIDYFKNELDKPLNMVNLFTFISTDQTQSIYKRLNINYINPPKGTFGHVD